MKPSPLDGELSDGELEPDERIAHEDLTERLVRMLDGWEDDDLSDETWVPSSVRKDKKKAKAAKKGAHLFPIQVGYAHLMCVGSSG